MGQRQDKDEIVSGDNCGGCEEILWPAGGTPKYIYARFALVELCPQAWCVNQPLGFNDHTFKLTQLDLNPCFWQYESDKWWIEYNCDELPLHRTHLYLDGFDGTDWDGIFRSTTAENVKCVTFFNNQLNCGAPHICGTGGYAVVTWQRESINLMGTVNISTAPNVFMEMRPLANANRVYKYCKLEDATNIQILCLPGKVHRVTGTLTPNATGDYYKHILHNGKMSYRRTDGLYFLWWNGADTWIINTGLDILVPPAWLRVDPSPVGAYQPIGAWLGVATVTEIW